MGSLSCYYYYYYGGGGNLNLWSEVVPGFWSKEIVLGLWSKEVLPGFLTILFTGIF